MKNRVFVLMFLFSNFFVFVIGNAQKLNDTLHTTNQLKWYNQRVRLLRKTSGLASFWDFTLREDGINGKGKFIAYTAKSDTNRYVLEPQNISREFWHDGAIATMNDFPMLNSGPFGQAVQFKSPQNSNDLPVLIVPRSKLNNTPIDVKGPGKSLSMLVWLVYQDGNHAIAGLWHEGTDTKPLGTAAEVKVRGQRQYGMFAGLAANPGSVSVHLSENGLASFGDRYARHLATTKEKIEKVPGNASMAELENSWSVVGFVYNNKKKTITAYLNGNTTDYWIENPTQNNFYKHAANAWKQAQLAKVEGLQDGEDVNFPKDQYYCPPENKVLKEIVVSETPMERIVIKEYEFTKTKITFKKNSKGKFLNSSSTELVAIKANPYWFGKDIYSPKSELDGSPFTIGRVIHSNRHPTLSAYFGGVAVYNKVLRNKDMIRLSKIGRTVEFPVFSMTQNK